jgi:hypothetical protein
MRYEKIVVLSGRTPGREVVVEETNALNSVRESTLKTVPR